MTAETSAIEVMRAANRITVSTQRSTNREDRLKRKRASLLEAEALVAGITVQQFKELCLKVKNKKTTFEVLRAIKNSCFSPGRTEVFMKTENAVNSLVRFLVGRDAQMQLEAAACLTNLACGSHKASHRITKACGPYLVSFLGSGSPYLRDQCAWACGNIARCCFQCYSLLKTQGVVPALLVNIQSPVPDVVRSTMFALSACTKYEDDDLRDLANDVTINGLLKLLDQENLHRSAQSDLVFTLSNILSLLAKDSIEMSASTVETILIHLEKSVIKGNIDVMITLPLVRCLGFASTLKSTCLYLVQQPIFKRSVTRILSCDCRALVLTVIWVLTNILGCCDISIENVDLNVVFSNILSNNPMDMSEVQVLYFLCAWASKNETVRVLLREQKCVSKIQELLKSGDEGVQKGAKMLLDILT